VVMNPEERAYFGIRLEDGVALVVVDGSEPPALRSYGPGDSARDRLLGLLAEWTEAGRPGVERLRISALPAGAAPRTGEGDLILRRPSATLVLCSELESHARADRP